MKNLAGDPHATEIVINELTRCGINIAKLDGYSGEVPSTVWGRLGSFTFRRAWYYYVVEGRVPLSIAKKLYETPIGKQDIRARGDGGCTDPEKICDWYDYLGNKLTTTSNIEEVKKWHDKLEETDPSKKTFADFLSNTRPIEDVPPDVRKGFVDLYHIDSELGLYIFTETIKKARLV